MYGTNQNIIDNLIRQKDRIDDMIKSYQQPQPVNNFINTMQTPANDMVTWRVLNENEEVDNLYVPNRTLFVSDNLMVLKGVDGSLEKWEIKKVYPVDKKDEKITALENEILKLKEVINNEHKQPIEPARYSKQPASTNDVATEPSSKTTSKSISK